MNKDIKPIYIVTILLPLVGFIAGSVQCAKGDNEGLKVVGWAFLWFVIWMIFMTVTGQI